MKNELGLIKRCDDTGCFVWYHTGGTAAKTHYRDMELTDVSSNEYSSEYAVPSLFERYIRQQADRDVSDLIDSDDISDETKEYMEIRNEIKRLDAITEFWKFFDLWRERQSKKIEQARKQQSKK